MLGRSRRYRRPISLALLATLAGFCSAGAHATSLRACDPPDTLTAAQKDKIFSFGAVIKAELEKSGQRLALISRAGLDLDPRLYGDRRRCPPPDRIAATQMSFGER